MFGYIIAALIVAAIALPFRWLIPHMLREREQMSDEEKAELSAW